MFFPLMSIKSDLATDEQVYSDVDDVDDKAAGWPWRTLRVPTKGQAVRKFGLRYLREYFAKYTSVISSTLKDEIRPIGKDARFFRPADVASYVEALTLFRNQNEYLIDCRNYIFSRYITPGPDISNLYARLNAFSNKCYGSDGSQWDASFPEAIADLIASWRASHSKEPERIFRYYRQMYCGYTNVAGYLFAMLHNPSGHFNTSMDNGLCNCIVMLLTAYRLGIPLHEFDSSVCFSCCGDDLIWADACGCFTAREVELTYNSLDIYAEFESYEPRSVFELSFVGTQPSADHIHYHYNVDRMRASALISRKGTDPVDHICKLVCLLMNVWYSDARQEFLDHTWSVIRGYVDANLISESNPTLHSLCNMLRPDAMEWLYSRYESIGVGRF